MASDFDTAMAHWDKRLGQPIDEKGHAYFIDSPGEDGRVFAIGDIHGSFQTFVKLLDQLALTKNDLVFVLGDMIDRGPFSLLVVEYIWQLMREGFQILPLRGNHEQLIIDMAKIGKGNLRTFADRQSAGHLAVIDKDRHKHLVKFFKRLPLFYEMEDTFFVHAGFESAAKHPLKRWEAMAWIRSFEYDKKKFSGKRIYHGHVPTSLADVQKALKNEKPVVSLDNGCAKAGADGYGKLLCLEVKSGDLFVQENVDVVAV